MTPIDYFTWFVLLVIAVTIVVGFVALAGLPGKLAAERQHPQADAIKMAGWLGMLLTAGVVWIVAMVWSQMKPLRPLVAAAQSADEPPPPDTQPQLEALDERLAAIEMRLQALREAAS